VYTVHRVTNSLDKVDAWMKVAYSRGELGQNEDNAELGQEITTDYDWQTE